VWAWYCEIARTVDETIGYPDIDAWRRLTGRRPAPWEIETILALDALRRSMQ